MQSVYIPLNEPLSIVNLKKGVVSLFQFQLLDQETNETDSSGHCVVSYYSTGPTSFKKTKKQCQASEDTPYLLHPDNLFSVNVDSKREATYQMANDNSCINTLTTSESHEMIVNIRRDAGNKVSTMQELKLTQTSSTPPIVSDKLDDVVQQIGDQLGTRFTHESLMTEREPKICQDAQCPSFSKLVEENMANIKSENYGKVKGATGYLRTLNAAREAKKDEIMKVLKKKKYRDIL